MIHKFLTSLAARRISPGDRNRSILPRRGYGRPATFSTTDTTQFKRAIDMTDDELVAIIAQAKAKLTVVK